MQIVKRYCDLCNKETPDLFEGKFGMLSFYGKSSLLTREYEICTNCLSDIQNVVVTQIQKIIEKANKKD